MKKGKIVSAVVLAAVSACAIYFLTSKRTAKQRKELVAFINKMKAEVIEKMKELSEITKQDYDKIVDEISAKYEKLSKVSTREFNNIVKEIKDGWKYIKKAI
jgi:C4-dicarboxylate-specific signal transduction histidine kinase